MADSINSEVAAQIIREVAANTRPERSKVRWTTAAKKFMEVVKKEWERHKRKNPTASLSAPNDLDGLP